MLKIGLTGGIGCGKSTVCNLFNHHGVPIVDTDELAREVVKPGSSVIVEMTSLFGKEILQPDRSLNREKLRQIVFTDSEKLQQLEAITHPAIRQLLHDKVASIRQPYAIVAIPLLLEKHWQDEVDRVLVIDCDETTQLERTMARDGSEEHIIRSIISSQVPREKRLEAADDIIHNDADIYSLRLQVEKLHRYYTKIAMMHSE